MGENMISDMEREEKIQIFFESQTYTFIIEKYNGMIRYHNGFIKENDTSKEYIKLYDEKLDRVIPIKRQTIVKIDYSDKKDGGKKNG